MAVRLRPRSPTLRTPDVQAHEALGLQLGRLAMADPAFRDAITKGYSLALREHAAQRRPDRAAAVAELEQLRGELAKVHRVRKRRRR